MFVYTFGNIKSEKWMLGCRHVTFVATLMLFWVKCSHIPIPVFPCPVIEVTGVASVQSCGGQCVAQGRATEPHRLLDNG